MATMFDFICYKTTQAILPMLKTALFRMFHTFIFLSNPEKIIC